MEKKILTENEARQMLPNNIEFVKEEGLMERLNVEGYITLEELIQRINNANEPNIR